MADSYIDGMKQPFLYLINMFKIDVIHFNIKFCYNQYENW